MVECGPCPFASFTLAFALQLRKKHGKTCQGKKTLSQVKKNLSQSTVYILPKHPHKHTHYKIHTYTHTHTLQNNIKPPQYKLKQTECKIYPNEMNTQTLCVVMCRCLRRADNSFRGVLPTVVCLSVITNPQ